MTTITEQEAMDMYHEMLEECYEEVSVCGMMMTQADILRDHDPIAYRCGFSDYVSELESEHDTHVEGY